MPLIQINIISHVSLVRIWSCARQRHEAVMENTIMVTNDIRYTYMYSIIIHDVSIQECNRVCSIRISHFIHKFI